VPEGDTIWRTARTLHAVLAGKTVLAFDSSLPSVAAAARRLGVVGQTVEAVEARGKHLLVRFSVWSTAPTRGCGEAGTSTGPRAPALDCARGPAP
jgi:formamidopyrimidine-DNA glycosylase